MCVEGHQEVVAGLSQLLHAHCGRAAYDVALVELQDSPEHHCRDPFRYFIFVPLVRMHEFHPGTEHSEKIQPHIRHRFTACFCLVDGNVRFGFNAPSAPEDLLSLCWPRWNEKDNRIRVSQSERMTA